MKKHGKSKENLRKSRETQGKSTESQGNSTENLGKTKKNPRKILSVIFAAGLLVCAVETLFLSTLLLGKVKVTKEKME